MPNEGGVWLLGQPIHDLDEEGRAQFRRQHLGFIFQSFQLFAEYTALENVLFPLELQGKLPFMRLFKSRQISLHVSDLEID